MKKFGMGVLSTILAGAMLVGCGQQTNETAKPEAPADSAAKEAPADSGKTFNLKFSTASVPNDAHTKALEVLKEEIEKSTEGRVKVEIHHSSSLYNQDNERQALMRGNLEMAYTSAPWMAEFVPSLNMFTAGYMFKDYDHMTKVLNGEIGKQVFEEVVEKTGVRPLGAFYLGSREINLRENKEVKTPEDLKGVKLRMPNTPSWLFLGEALGANPTPLAFSELYMALSTGAVDGQDNPLPTVQNAKFYEVTKSISLTHHIIDSTWPTINEEVWQEMGPELQEKMVAAVEKAREFTDQTNLKAEAELVEFMKQQGLTVTEPDREAFSTQVLNKYLENKEITKDWNMDLYQQVQDMAK
ncbi:sialic acid TRAP transporter substrate-binding protein SiaP [Ammoniphilus sp. 3BR4]|uniref:sialic acid TRAP transporter substrate-binding protein SiaP n=1 Tax=Ammoniphilus sp. 3BR4 TaxID=3158265 RepID=UPI0034671506